MDLVKHCRAVTLKNEKNVIIVGSAIIIAGILSSLLATIMLDEVHGWELVAQRDQAFSPAITRAHAFWQNALLLSAGIVIVGVGTLDYGVFKKGAKMRFHF